MTIFESLWGIHWFSTLEGWHSPKIINLLLLQEARSDSEQIGKKNTTFASNRHHRHDLANHHDHFPLCNPPLSHRLEFSY
ncbi:unnamed protein product [Lactuca virosa]|uniref:Uncharacterized protein n=1 Tax=Lactuca virosa TaxID=75947 RepID=A0AAU9NR37_9ASTR|nr:unnamed protein product [Lactuca virosa]